MSSRAFFSRPEPLRAQDACVDDWRPLLVINDEHERVARLPVADAALTAPVDILQVQTIYVGAEHAVRTHRREGVR